MQVLVLTIALFIFFEPSVWAANFQVTNLNDSGVGSLRQAIIDANADRSATPGSPHTIDFTIAGEVSLNVVLPDINNHIILQGNGSSIRRASGGNYRILFISSANTVIINDVDLYNGNTNSGNFGAGIFIQNATVTLNNCVISDNSSGSNAGGVYLQDGTLTLNSCTVQGNSAIRGGGIYNNNGIFTLFDCWIDDNTADFGGGIYAQIGTYNIGYSTISNNRANLQGGGIYNQDTDVEIINCTVYNNQAIAQQGGGLFHQTSTNTMAIINSTFSQNQSTNGAGIYSLGILNLTNNILANSIGGTDILNDGGTIGTNANNLVESCSGSCPSWLLTTDPGLLAFNSVDSRPPILPLSEGSAAIDAGTNAGVNIPVDDQYQSPRVGSPDLGAFESGSNPLPITLGYFNGKRLDSETVLLQWLTYQEIDNKVFEIQQSAQGLEFQTIAFVDGAGNSSSIKNYELQITNSEAAYYRLKQVDFNGSFSYSQVIFIEGDLEIHKLQVFPNPTIEQLNLALQPDINSEIKLDVFDSQGKRVFSELGSLQNINQNLNIHIPHWSNGWYILKLKIGNRLLTQKVVLDK